MGTPWRRTPMTLRSTRQRTRVEQTSRNGCPKVQLRAVWMIIWDDFLAPIRCLDYQAYSAPKSRIWLLQRATISRKVGAEDFLGMKGIERTLGARKCPESMKCRAQNGAAWVTGL